jgi:hypothetical protein
LPTAVPTKVPWVEVNAISVPTAWKADDAGAAPAVAGNTSRPAAALAAVSIRYEHLIDPPSSPLAWDLFSGSPKGF